MKKKIEGGKITAKEMVVLIDVIKSILKTFKNKKKIEGAASKVRIFVGFINQLLLVQD